MDVCGGMTGGQTGGFDAEDGFVGRQKFPITNSRTGLDAHSSFEKEDDTARKVLNSGLANPNLTLKAEPNPCLRDFGVTVQMHGCLAELTRRKPHGSF